MKHPEVILIPLLMFADYMLTVLGARQRETGYGQHFKMPNYELNPVWQKAIAQNRWFNLRHTVLTLFFFVVLLYLVEFGGMPEIYPQILLGAILTIYGYILARHLSNLLVFRRVRRLPHEVSGEITLTQTFATAISFHQCLHLTIPLVILAYFSRNGYVIGGAAGAVVLMLLTLSWLQRAEDKVKSTTTV